MKDLNTLNDFRVPHPAQSIIGKLPEEMKKGNGCFRIYIDNEEYFVMASDGMEWDHVSISHAKEIPSWEVMCKVKEMFFEDEEVVMQLHPKKSEYVNMVNTCLHLWRPQNKNIPTPPSIMVGFKLK